MTDAERRGVVVVSGLPRSGTSMMMQMLRAGGLPILTDDLRQPDEDNPRGYLEFEPVKAMARDASWIDRAEGHAVKIIHLLLEHLPAGHAYRVILMRRPVGEVLASQRAMLRRQGREGASLDDARMGEIFNAQMERARAWLADREGCEVLEVAYHDVVADPASQARRVAEFVGGHLDVEAMAEAVDPSLYRQRS